MIIPDSILSTAHTILDVGGWFKPEPKATHVIDLMPWETRGARLCKERAQNENFSRRTWFQADFLDPNLRMPFEDNFFDFVICGHTIEDLSNPVPVLREMARVGKQGLIECPSRLAEQSIGIKNRMDNVVGYDHHHWIADVANEKLCLYLKSASNLSGDVVIPFNASERFFREGYSQNVQYFWHGSINFDLFIDEKTCSKMAQEFSKHTSHKPFEKSIDSIIRLLRRIKYKRYNNQSDCDWWGNIVELSKPYSSIEL